MLIRKKGKDRIHKKKTKKQKKSTQGPESKNDTKDHSITGSQKFRNKLILQFDKGHRLAFYWPK